MDLLPSPSLTFSFNLACVSNNQLGGILDLLIITADNEEALDMQVQLPTLSDRECIQFCLSHLHSQALSLSMPSAYHLHILWLEIPCALVTHFPIDARCPNGRLVIRPLCFYPAYRHHTIASRRQDSLLLWPSDCHKICSVRLGLRLITQLHALQHLYRQKETAH